VKLFLSAHEIAHVYCPGERDAEIEFIELLILEVFCATEILFSNRLHEVMFAYELLGVMVYLKPTDFSVCEEVRLYACPADGLTKVTLKFTVWFVELLPGREMHEPDEQEVGFPGQ